MRRITFIAAFLFMAFPELGATHNRAGEITLTQTGEFTFRILIKTFTYSLSAADRSELEVRWGDNSSTTALRNYIEQLPNFYNENHYTATHTYPGPGTYTITVQDPNRNYGVLNIPNSVNVIFSIKTTITINPSIGRNSTPVLLNRPIDRAALGHRFIHNAGAYDPDGDSLSYELTVCTEENGQPIQGYTYPEASDSLMVDSISGDLIWDAPVEAGIFNIAIKIKEWRKGVAIGSINRDMQIEVLPTENREPVNQALNDFCVEAGTLISYSVTSTDPDNDRVVQQAVGGPFVQKDSPATFKFIASGPGFSTSVFSWKTSCSHIRQQPYSIVIKSEDRPDSLILVDIDNFRVKVIGPAPRNPMAVPGSNTIRLSWDMSLCSNAAGYKVYRRNGHVSFTPDSCRNGVPPDAGYQLAETIEGRENTFFIDDNNGDGLSQGIEYCYLITAVFGNGTESYASREACAVLIPGKPSMLNVSVTEVAEEGTIFLAWAKPLGLDTISPNGPYKYRISRYRDLHGHNLAMADSFVTADLNDTTYTDIVNTEIFPYSYRVELFYTDTLGNYTRYGEEETVSSLFLEIKGTDNLNIIRIRKKVPWVNDLYVVYRQNKLNGSYDSIGITAADTFADPSLANGQQYCYQVRSIGQREIHGRVYINENYSHIACATPTDTIPPCPPLLRVRSNCDSLQNELEWTNPNNSCADDVVRYNIYYTPVDGQQFELLDSTLAATDTTYIHKPPEGMAGCYVVTAVDSFNNESGYSPTYCVQNCVEFDLPNVFSPNGDDINDYFITLNKGYIEKVDMRIFNRWGQMVFRTNDPDINWDGKHMNTNSVVSPGVYYYICDLYVRGLTGENIMNIVGFIYVYTEKDAVKPSEK